MFKSERERIDVRLLARKLIPNSGKLQGLLHINIVFGMKIRARQHKVVTRENTRPIVRLPSEQLDERSKIGIAIAIVEPERDVHFIPSASLAPVPQRARWQIRAHVAKI